jgi:hypothetical protein
MSVTKQSNMIDSFQITPERRKDNRDWPGWLNLAWNRDRHEDSAVSCRNYPNSDGTDQLTLTVHDLLGVITIAWYDWLILTEEGRIEHVKRDLIHQYRPQVTA